MKYQDMKYQDIPFHIYWFSGSGNSLIIAVEIRDYLTSFGYQVKLFPLEKTVPGNIDRNAIIGFVIPVAGQSTHPFIWEFLDNLPKANGALCFLVDTLGMYSGGILGPVKKIIKRKGYTPLAAKEILMPNNFQKRNRRPEKEREMIEKGKKAAREFCEQLINGQGSWFDIPIYSRFISIMYRHRSLVNIWRKMFPLVIDKEKCTKCGTCIKLCPEKSLIMDEKQGIPINSSNCTLCQRCFAFCPSNAIQVGNQKTVAYRALSLKEMMSYLKLDIDKKEENWAFQVIKEDIG